MAAVTQIIIGLTGLYCSGKSTAEIMLKEQYDFKIIDVDKVGHQVLEEQSSKLVSIFGNSILTCGKIDRKKLAEIVFYNKKMLNKLNTLVHPLMIKKIKAIIDQLNTPKICINAALLFEMQLDQFCNKIIVVKSSLLTLIKRALKRDRRSFFQVLKIIFTQKVLRLAKKNSFNVDIFYINNNHSLMNFKQNIQKIMTEILL